MLFIKTPLFNKIIYYVHPIHVPGLVHGSPQVVITQFEGVQGSFEQVILIDVPDVLHTYLVSVAKQVSVDPAPTPYSLYVNVQSSAVP